MSKSRIEALGAAEVAPVSGPSCAQGSDQGGTVRIALNDIALDDAYRGRTRPLCEKTLRRYAHDYLNGVELPPLVVARRGRGFVLVEGWHRHAALLSITPRREAVCRVIEADPKELPWLAFQSNLKHGRGLSRQERRAAFSAYVKAGKYKDPKGGFRTYREIAADLGGVAHTTVRNWMMGDFPKIAKAMSSDDDFRGAGGLVPLEDPEKVLAERTLATLREAVAALKTMQNPAHRSMVGRELYELVQAVQAAGVYAPADY